MALEPKWYGMRGATGQLVYTLRRSRPSGYFLLMTAEPLVTRSVRSVVWEGVPARGLPIPMGELLWPMLTVAVPFGAAYAIEL